jgi:hypothetical protein
MSGLSRTPGKRVYGESRTAGSNPALSANMLLSLLNFEAAKKLTGVALGIQSSAIPDVAIRLLAEGHEREA